MLKSFSRVVSSISLIGILVACGGGGGGGGSVNSPVTIAGLAIDGYLENAKVCLDLNFNFRCDGNEPSTFTDEDGRYSFTYNGDPRGIPVITETSPATKDSDDNGKTFEEAKRDTFVLAAPIPWGGVYSDIKITPLTTAVTIAALPSDLSALSAASTRLEQTAVELANRATRELLGIDPSKDILKLDTTKDAELHPVAQVMSIVLGGIQSGVLENSADKMKTAVVATKEIVSSMVENGTVSNDIKSALALAPDKRTQAVLESRPEIQSTIQGTAKIVNRGTSPIDAKEVIKQGLVSFELDSGYNPVDPTREGQIGNWKRGWVLDVTFIKGDVDTKTLTEVERVLDDVWQRSANWSRDHFLNASGNWIPEEEDFSKRFISFDKNCVIDKGNPLFSHSMRFCLDGKDLSGLKVSDVNPDYCKGVDVLDFKDLNEQKCAAAKFKEGSIGYELTLSIEGSDAFRVDIPIRESDRAFHYGNQWGGVSSATNINEFLDMLNQNKSNPLLYMNIWDGFSLKLKSFDSSSKTGVFNWFYDHDDNHSTAPRSAGESTFEVRRVNGVDIVILKVALEYHRVKRGEMVGKDFIFAAVDNKIRFGEAEYVAVKQRLGIGGYQGFGNQPMFESILEGLEFNGTPLPPFPFAAPN